MTCLVVHAQSRPLDLAMLPQSCSNISCLACGASVSHFASLCCRRLAYQIPRPSYSTLTTPPATGQPRASVDTCRHGTFSTSGHRQGRQVSAPRHRSIITPFFDRPTAKNAPRIYRIPANHLDATLDWRPILLHLVQRLSGKLDGAHHSGLVHAKEERRETGTDFKRT